MDGPTCQHCGSDDLRQAHVHSWRRKLYRSLTGAVRFECLACRRRGWSDLPLPRRGADGQRLQPAPGRRLEHRDLAASRQVRRQRLLGTLTAVGLGVLASGYLLWACT